MDAWEILTGNSSLSDGDAWEHLNAKEGGGSILVEAIMSADVVSVTSASCESENLTADIIDVLSANIIDDICSSSVSQENLTAD